MNSINNPVCSLIDIIKSLTNEEYDYKINYLPSEFYFKSGGCYELVKILKHFLPDSEVYVSNDFEHCAFFYKGILYDITGIIDEIDNFHAATPIDLDYLNDTSFYGRAEIKFRGKIPSDALIEDLSKCKINNLIESCKELDHNPEFYNNKQKNNIKTPL